MEALRKPRLTVCLSFDFDALSNWIGSLKTKSAPALSRGEFGAHSISRILSALRQRDVRCTFFVPGHTALAFPDAVRAISADGHEIAHHGWVTGTGNVVPRECVELEEHVKAGRLDEARRLYAQLLPLMRLDMTTHLVQYYKAAMDAVGLRGGPVRPPRLPLDREQQGLLDAAMQALSLPNAA